ncbi:hypothetical protein KKH36_03750 [Patescibacteria group bacterium]|nr:hypothetical protein [Patescibacteria group bacterium]
MENELKKYRLGNQPEKYELKEEYLGWTPIISGWEHLLFERTKNKSLVITDPKSKYKKTLFLHHFIIKDAFPLSFFGEERSKNWSHFAIVSENKDSEKFVIPLY